MGAIIPYGDLSYGTDMTMELDADRLDYGDGYSQRAERGLNSVRQTWRLNWKAIPDPKAEELRLFFKALGGAAIIDWRPYNQPAALKWTASRFASTPAGWLISNCSVVLTQEFDL